MKWAQAMSAYSGTMEESQLLSSVYFDSWNLSHGENSSVWASSHPGEKVQMPPATKSVSGEKKEHDW